MMLVDMRRTLGIPSGSGLTSSRAHWLVIRLACVLSSLAVPTLRQRRLKRSILVSLRCRGGTSSSALRAASTHLSGKGQRLHPDGPASRLSEESESGKREIRTPEHSY